MTALLHSGGWLFYAAAALAYVAFLLRPSPRLGAIATSILAIGFAGHTVCFAVQAFGSGISFGSAALLLSLIAWGIVGIFLAVLLRSRLTVVGAFVAPVATVFAVLAELAPGSPAPSRSLPTWWLTAHLVSLLLGYAAFSVSFCLAAIYLIQERFLKSRRLGGLFRRLPSLEALDRLNRFATAAGFVLLSIGLFLGAAWVTVKPTAGERVWEDPLVLLTSALWLWYAYAVQSHLFAGWRGRKSAVFSVVGFAALLVSIVGISLSTRVHFFG